MRDGRARVGPARVRERPGRLIKLSLSQEALMNAFSPAPAARPMQDPSLSNVSGRADRISLLLALLERRQPIGMVDVARHR